MDRYNKFLLDESELPGYSEDSHEGLNIVHHNISEVEQCENQAQCRLFEGIYYTLCELFEVDDVEMETTFDSQSLFLITKTETDFNNQVGFRSPELSRKKLKGAEPKEVAEAIIDLFKNRKKWDNKKECKTLHI